MLRWISLFLLLLSSHVYASLPYHPLQFPRDEAAHYKNIPYTFSQLIEWWYFNGKLTTDDGRHFSYDVALFHPARAMGKNLMTMPVLHIQISDLDNKKSYGTSFEYPLNSGKISTNTLDIEVADEFSLKKSSVNGKEIYSLKAVGSNDDDTTLKLNLVLEKSSEIFLINENGLMPMMQDTNSYYYTIPHFKTTGSIQINNNSYNISKTPGDSWNDHQWGDFKVDKSGWEWFSIRLENGLDANMFLIHDFASKKIVGGLANIILPSGEKKFISYKDFTITRNDYWYDSKLALSYPMTFNFSFPQLNLEIKNVAAFPEQELHGYWEGYCNVNGTYQNKDVNGFSFAEIVYRKPTGFGINLQ